MSKFQFYNGQLDVDISSTLNCDFKKLVSGIADQFDNISWAVMEREVHGAIFVSMSEQSDLLICHGSLIQEEYVDAEQAHPDQYLWVVIDQVDSAFRARFLNQETVSKLNKNDLINVKDYELLLLRQEAQRVGSHMQKALVQLMLCLTAIAVLCGILMWCFS